MSGQAAGSQKNLLRTGRLFFRYRLLKVWSFEAIAAAELLIRDKHALKNPERR